MCGSVILIDYPEKRLFQNLKFRFPLSITNAYSLTNTGVVNQYSALHYPKQVIQYLENKKCLGASVGPIDHPHSNFDDSLS